MTRSIDLTTEDMAYIQLHRKKQCIGLHSLNSFQIHSNIQRDNQSIFFKRLGIPTASFGACFGNEKASIEITSTIAQHFDYSVLNVPQNLSKLFITNDPHYIIEFTNQSCDIFHKSNRQIGIWYLSARMSLLDISFSGKSNINSYISIITKNDDLVMINESESGLPPHNPKFIQQNRKKRILHDSPLIDQSRKSISYSKPKKKHNDLSNQIASPGPKNSTIQLRYLIPESFLIVLMPNDSPSKIRLEVVQNDFMYPPGLQLCHSVVNTGDKPELILEQTIPFQSPTPIFGPFSENNHKTQSKKKTKKAKDLAAILGIISILSTLVIFVSVVIIVIFKRKQSAQIQEDIMENLTPYPDQSFPSLTLHQ